MVIAGVATVYNEADIIESCIRHHFAEGVGRILVADASTDDTPDILHALADEFDLRIFRDEDDHHFQPKWINWLAEQAHADWVVPFDADEFWYGASGQTVADAIAGVPAGVTKLYARMFQHRDWDHRHVHRAPFPKCAYRFGPAMRVANGNHDVSGPGAGLWGILDLRELQFRSFEHFCEKSTARTVRIDPSLPETEGAHQRVLHALDMDGKARAWAEWNKIETVVDPIPSRACTGV